MEGALQGSDQKSVEDLKRIREAADCKKSPLSQNKKVHISS
jgi:hypothetical protein